MTANRVPPTLANTPGGITGSAFAAAIADEILALYDGRYNQVTSVGGSANSITGVCTPPLTASPAHGMTFRLTPGANNTGAVDIDIDSVGSISLKDEDGNALDADDIVSGRPITFWYDSGASAYRLIGQTEQDIIAAAVAAVGGNSYIEQIGDTTIAGTVAGVEHDFASAERYSLVIAVAVGISTTSGSNNLNLAVRNAAGTLVIATGNIGGSGIAAAQFSTLVAIFTLDEASANARHTAMSFGTTNGGTIQSPAVVQNNTSNIPEQVTIHPGSGNLDAGRFYTYGIRKTL